MVPMCSLKAPHNLTTALKLQLGLLMEALAMLPRLHACDLGQNLEKVNLA
jgi:hypothetical protein